MADSESPLRFLDRDVSLMIYEKYYPSKEAKEWKELSDDQFKYHLKEYRGSLMLQNGLLDIDSIEQYCKSFLPRLLAV